MKLTLSKEFARRPEIVWQFLVVDHVRNHPRWDPKMQLRSLTDGPIRVGTRVARRHTHAGMPTDGTMEVVEFEPPRVFGAVIHDEYPAGVVEIRSRMTLAPSGDGQTTLTLELELPGTDTVMDPGPIEGSLARMKELIEAET